MDAQYYCSMGQSNWICRTPGRGLMQPYSDKERMVRLQQETKSGPQQKKKAPSTKPVQPSTSKRSYQSSVKAIGKKKGGGELIDS